MEAERKGERLVPIHFAIPPFGDRRPATFPASLSLFTYNIVGPESQMQGQGSPDRDRQRAATSECPFSFSAHSYRERALA